MTTRRLLDRCPVIGGIFENVGDLILFEFQEEKLSRTCVFGMKMDNDNDSRFCPELFSRAHRFRVSTHSCVYPQL